MLKSVWAAGSVAAIFSTAALAIPFQHADSSSVPLLSGTYIIADQTFCQESMTAAEKSGAISTIKVTGSDNSLSAGTIKFEQGSKSGAGTLTLTQTSVSGTPLLASGSAITGNAGDTLKESTGTINTTFSQTATTFSFANGSTTDSFNVYYGKVSGGIAQYVAFAGVDDEGCAQRGTLTIK